MDVAVLFLLYVIVEVAAVTLVASYVGIGWTLLLLLAGAVLGSLLAKREGRRAMDAVMRAARSGASPHKEISDGMLVALGGVLILVPGFVSDLVGLLFLLPGTRSLMRKVVARSAGRRSERMHVYGMSYGHGAQQDGRRDDDPMVVDGEIVDEPKRRPRGDDGPQIVEGGN
jgi:UPF0716 protein FxsA